MQVASYMEVKNFGLLSITLRAAETGMLISRVSYFRVKKFILGKLVDYEIVSPSKSALCCHTEPICEPLFITFDTAKIIHQKAFVKCFDK